MEDLIIKLSVNYPEAIAVLSLIGVLRAINKPLFALLRAYAAATKTLRDDEFLIEVEKSKAYQYFVFVLDYLTSVKLPK